MKLENKVAIITGGTGGIGTATAIRFAQEGAKVVITDLDSPKGGELTETINHSGGTAHFIPADLTDEAALKQVFAETIKQFGKIDIIVNNAGIEGTMGPLHATSASDWSQLLAVNQTALFQCMQLGIQHFLSTKNPGVIVNTASVAGVGQAAGMAAYGATKHAVVGLTRSAAIEYGKFGIRVNAVCPGIIKTPMTERSIDEHAEMLEFIKSRLALKRFGQAHEIASAIFYLASDESTYMTGQTLVVDGGMRA